MSEVNITPETKSDTQAHIDAMVAKADAAAAQKPAPAVAPADAPAATPERPAWLPEKFATPEDMAKAYAEAEKKLSAPKEADAPADAEAKEAADKAVAAAGLDMDALGTKIAAKGDLDDADYEALSKQGITKDMVKSYVAGQQAIANQMVARMHETVGGQDSFNSLLSWAGENLSADEITAFNATVDNGSEAAVKLALMGLHSQYKAAGGAAPNLVGGKRQDTTGGDVFRSTAEVTKAMSDPRYARDAAYRADVMAKLGRSNVI